ncbi:MAG: acyl-CoA dehydrogenase family protein [Acidimicrobiales bacterium]|jgi:alkylation response protein AidB-like acyl-CoA dehydrogenase|nr:acyl-CoA dehydrogenase family protein [Acidimicrobiales bacterium]MDP6298338.1 acyl-CoA dehydrogenase family protein [Acidimicrobiales bacterium]HJM28280.1 acyl-CoA dehydrogenase family protein [Acidimicrobiales bacterium]HJM97752.1 acyl-CoA dehydrogenase family protein [Acidimicrobiales bacterium]
MADENLTDAEQESFRIICREFLDEHAVGIHLNEPDPRDKETMGQNKAFQGKLAEAGLAGLIYPKEYGGAGLTKAHETIWREECGKYPEMTSQLTISHGMCLPMLNEFGNEEQKEKHLADIIAARTVWCQMFSEPGAGSDVASLQTRAELDGDEWIINGQKVWTTLAHVCDYGVLIARTNPEVAKHAGISMFIVDMSDPAVEIRPIHQIDGGMHFNEVFFTDLRIPKDNLLGPLHEGWRLATSMLMYERVAIGTGSTGGITTPHTKRLIEHAQKKGNISNPVVRQKLMKLYSEETAKSLVSMRTRAELQAGKTPGPGGSLGKLHGSKILRDVRSLINDVVGMETDAWTEGDRGQWWGRLVLGSFQAGIAGGTDEIQKNIIGDRVLGLPREPSVDKGVPFKDLLVGTQKDR